MQPNGVAEVREASGRGLQDLDRAGEIARSMLPDARLTPTSDPLTAFALRKINEIAVPGASADLFASLYLDGMHPKGPFGDPRAAAVPGLPPEISSFFLSWPHLVALHDGTIPPAELSILETQCQEAARAVCDRSFQIPGSSAGQNELAGPQRVADLATLNSALHRYWTEFQNDAGGVKTQEEWANVEEAKAQLEVSMGSSVLPAPAVTAPTEPDFAPPNEVARLTAQAQSDPLHTLYSHLPGHAHPNDTRISESVFVQSLLGWPRFMLDLLTFPYPPVEMPMDAAMSVPNSEPTTTADTEPGQSNAENEPTGSTRVSGETRPSGGGLVIVPELTRPEDPIGDLIAGGRPDQTPTPPNLRPEPEPPLDPNEFGPNPSPRDAVPAAPTRPEPETFPGRDAELERTLAPSGVPGLRTFPLGQEELPVELPVGSYARTPITAPIPSDPSVASRGTATSAAASPALTSGRSPAAAQPAVQSPVRSAPMPNGGRGVVTGVQQFAGAGPRSTPGSATTVRDPRTGVESVSIQPSTVKNADGTTTVFIPEIAGARVGYNPVGTTAVVVELAQGQSGRVTPQTPVTELTVRTESAPPLGLNGGGDPTRSVPGVVYRDPNPDRPTREIVTIIPARYVDPQTGQER
ncbi:MAG: hypothetical protein LH624_08995, partial [Cryobacterium sp.]|nr:hypothetical protein [Cryobacterium sp.]